MCIYCLTCFDGFAFSFFAISCFCELEIHSDSVVRSFRFCCLFGSTAREIESREIRMRLGNRFFSHSLLRRLLVSIAVERRLIFSGINIQERHQYSRQQVSIIGIALQININKEPGTAHKLICKFQWSPHFPS
jgi:hypothetical protein